MHYGGLLVSAGRWDDAERELVAAVDIYERTWHGSRFEPLVRLADLRVRQGRVAEARRLLRGFEGVPEAAAALARVHLLSDEPMLAVRVIERSLSRRGRGLASVALLGLLVEALLTAGRHEEAAEVAHELEGLAGATGQPAVKGVASMAAARVAVARSDGRAVELLEGALGAFAAAQLPYELARTRLALAEALGTADPELARAEAHAAMTGFDELHAARDADVAAALLHTLGARGQPRSTGAGALTPRESEVLELLTRGRSNAGIAADLHISERTAEDHVSNILAKLGLANRTEAAAYALRSGSGKRDG
jgi:DNA-binding CsgD family transcriptional regulator